MQQEHGTFVQSAQATKQNADTCKPQESIRPYFVQDGQIGRDRGSVQEAENKGHMQNGCNKNAL